MDWWIDDGHMAFANGSCAQFQTKESCISFYLQEQLLEKLT